MWVEFVVGSRPCFERFFSGYSGFPLSSKINISKFQFDQLVGVPLDHFRVGLNLIMKARLSAKFLLRKLVFIHMQTKLIFI